MLQALSCQRVVGAQWVVNTDYSQPAGRKRLQFWVSLVIGGRPAQHQRWAMH
jgi:hypothetical protein